MKKLFELNKNDKHKRFIPISYAVVWRCLERPGTDSLRLTPLPHRTNARTSRYHPHDLYRSTLRRTDITVMVIRVFECICLLASAFGFFTVTYRYVCNSCMNQFVIREHFKRN